MSLVNFYKITSLNTPNVYVGSTVKTLEKRLSGHEAHYNLFLNSKFHYITSFEILESKDYSIELIESKLCETKIDKWAIERYHILNNPTAVNKFQPARTLAQYYIENKTTILIKQKQYYQNNKEQVKQKHNEKHNCRCGGKFTTVNKVRHEQSTKHQNYINQIQ